VRTLVVWEPVLTTDWGRPSTTTLRRIPDPGAVQFWDKGRLVSHEMGEHDEQSVVWDHIAVYPMGEVWKERAPEALYHGGPVVEVAGLARTAVAQALQRVPQLH
jgi:hypothetical protein